MPHGRLTPLGRQLASVLANIRPAPTCAPFGQKAPIQRSISHDNIPWTRAGGGARRIRDVKAVRARGHALAAVAVREEVEEDAEADLYQFPQLDDKRAAEYGVGRLGGIEHGGRIDRLPSGHLKHKGEPVNLSSNRPRPLIRFSPFVEGSPDVSLRLDKEYYAQGELTAELQLEAILFRHLKHKELKSNTTAGRSVESFELSVDETNFLESRNCTTHTIVYWADMVFNSDQHEAAVRLANLQSQEDAYVVPLFVLFHMLRKPYVSARTMRVLLKVAFRTLESYNPLCREDVFTLFTLSLRRVRDVWPAAMENLVDMLLQYLPLAQSQSVKDGDDRHSTMEWHRNGRILRGARHASLAFRLNKAMRLLAIPTSINPFLNVAIQESCVIRILRFLAEHDPPLEINRDGFRAVVLIQLASPKSDDDRLWAELKTLSWPPWKEDRTAMDIDITAREHGRSKAAETLERMREAGFAPHEWEKVAPTYAGWDGDGTPTTQTRVWFSSGKKRLASGAANWTARIQTTRTIQEAWACYLAYEEHCNEPDQDVCLAMFRKIYEEGERLQHSRRYKHFRKLRTEKKVWPGDAREIDPPPPSSHQHTYTRTSPPSLDGLYGQLREKGVVFEGPCLAFLLSKAASLKQGIEYLLASESVYPAVRGLLDETSPYDINTVPDIVFAGFMELLGRFSNFSLSKALPGEMKWTCMRHCELLNLKLNADHTLARGSVLLKRRLPHYRPAWNAILRSLGNNSSHMMLKAALASTSRSASKFTPPLAESDVAEQKFEAAQTALDLVRRIVEIMHSINLEPDSIGFLALCNVMENWTVTCWLQLQQQARKGSGLDVKPRAGPLNTYYPRLVKRVFRRFVGAEYPKYAVQNEQEFGLPALLEVPNPALLHAYIRVLGWMRDYSGLLGTVQLMLEYRKELQQRREMDRNGDVIMRRAIVALRVFLERSWLVESPSTDLPSAIDKETKLPYGEKVEEQLLEAHSDAERLSTALSLFKQPAKHERITEIKQLIESVEEWVGWPTDEEVEEYCRHSRFQQFNT